MTLTGIPFSIFASNDLEVMAAEDTLVYRIVTDRQNCARWKFHNIQYSHGIWTAS